MVPKQRLRETKLRAASRLYSGNVATASKPRTVAAFVTPMAAQSVAEIERLRSKGRSLAPSGRRPS